MRAVKLGLISITVLFIIGVLMGLLLPSRVIVSRAVDINGSRDQLKQKIFNLHQWKTWLPQADSTSADVKVLNNKNIELGKTTVTIYSTTDTSIITQWKSKSSLMLGTFNIISQPNHIQTLHWQMVQNVGWLPWERLGTMMNDKILGPSMESGLNNIKEQVESSR